ncbi:MAG: DUF2127 domain-containing protein [Solirubrobacterales bacterium]|nr:DUF2127 domain-containing protein [Solirubrobacterales bacterium]
MRGHALYGTDAAELRPQDAALAREEGEVRWYRCLRCDSWLALDRPRAPSSPHPPDRAEIVVPTRGKALRDKAVLRLIAADRAFHFLILVALGVAVLVFAADRQSLRGPFYRVMAALQGGVAGGPVQSSGHVGIARELDKLFSLRGGTLREVGIALLAFGALEGLEAIGLWFTKRWAEYLTFLATSLLLPLEVYEIIHRGSVLKVLGFIINLVIVIYLLLAKRLFGLRGGGAAEQAERDRDTGWEAIDLATPPIPQPAVGEAAPGVG